MNEIDKLEEISKKFGYSDGVMAASIGCCFKVLSRHLKGPSVLELGPAEGLMTDLLITTGSNITVVEGSQIFCESLKRRFHQIQIVHSLFETFQPTARFDTIILGHVLEHVIDPVGLLKQAKGWLNPGGRIFCAVPNANSIHRQAAVIMGLLKSEVSLNESDLQHGHRRVFSPQELKSTFIEAGLLIQLFGGYWLKPLSNQQIQSDWTQSMIDAFMILGERYPEISGEIYIVAV
jgi:2-polyprenyl-3-methyl-5-hydroxy-6-metoxy-1,4-benzoquinol methylase